MDGRRAARPPGPQTLPGVSPETRDLVSFPPTPQQVTLSHRGVPPGLLPAVCTVPQGKCAHTLPSQGGHGSHGHTAWGPVLQSCATPTPARTLSTPPHTRALLKPCSPPGQDPASAQGKNFLCLRTPGDQPRRGAGVGVGKSRNQQGAGQTSGTISRENHAEGSSRPGPAHKPSPLGPAPSGAVFAMAVRR